ncbi:BppU family phage baseplate upper protein, partial [Acinetobacter baumannii]|uniref:BppU family phage baseplate upper protein n=1 Tax=Acinetobacter baumannii TaxID=470 RepID=UPI002B1DC74B
MLQKMTDVSTNINVSTAENGFIGANFYTEDDGSAYIRITIKDNNQVLDFNKTDMLPRLDLFCSDGSIFTNEPLDILIPDKGVIQYKVSDNVIAHPGRMDAKLFLANENDSIHVANFYFTITDSGMTGPIGKEIHVGSLQSLVRNVMKENAIGLLDDNFKSKLETDLQTYVTENPDLFKGEKGPRGAEGIIKFDNLTETQKADLRSGVNYDLAKNISDLEIKMKAIDGNFFRLPVYNPEDFDLTDYPLKNKIFTNGRGQFFVDYDVSVNKLRSGKTYYINYILGSDANDGTTKEKAFKSINYAISKVQDND